jgi:hypothetical protein
VRRLNKEERRQHNENLAVGASAYSSGQLHREDPQLAELLDGLEKYANLEQDVADYYELAPAKQKADRMAGKVFLVPVKRQHDLNQHPLTHKAIAATQLYHEGGSVPLVSPPSIDAETAAMKQTLQEIVMPGSINKIGGGGEREETPRSDAEKLDASASLLAVLARGYNQDIGYAYGGMPLDVGHKISHTSRPDLSNKASNLTWENQYANKGKSATEKMAGQQGREATDEELAQGLFRSHINKLVADVVLPGRKGSAERREFMDPINAKVLSI